MNVVFLGPPGSGKGTQAKAVAEGDGLVHLSTGDIFREAISGKTEMGEEIKAFVDAGKLVPDELVSRVVFEKLKQLTKGFLLDGYPRTLDQAHALDVFAERNKISIDAVLFFDVAPEELVKRLSARRQCPSCKEVYNLANRPPKVEGKCDVCGASLIHRPDDQPEIVQERLRIYVRQTEPVLDFYKKRPRFHRIDAAKPIDDVRSQIVAALSGSASVKVPHGSGNN